MRKIIDWDYYKERVAGTIMKIVTIPAALQKCMNPVPKIQYPEWLYKRLKVEDDRYKQKDMKFFFKKASQQEAASNALRDIEDFAAANINKLTLTSAAQKKEEAQIAKNLIKEKENKYAKIEDCPSPEEEFSEWLKYQKSNWRKIRRIMKDDKQVIAASAGDKSKRHQGLTSFIRNMDDVVLKSNWHIIQISETIEPGILRVWALTEQG
jgi:DNA polymerase epsilon subunit 1